MTFTLNGLNDFLRGPQQDLGGTVTSGEQGGLLPFSPHQQGLLALSGALLEAGGPSLMPTSFGQGVGRGLQAMQGAQERARQAAMQRQYRGARLAKQTHENERRKAAEARWAVLNRPRPGAPKKQSDSRVRSTPEAEAITPLREMRFSPDEAAYLNTLPLEDRQKIVTDRRFGKSAVAPEKRIVEGADGFKNYTDDMPRGLPDVQAPATAPGHPFGAGNTATGHDVFATPEGIAAGNGSIATRPQQPPVSMGAQQTLRTFRAGQQDAQKANMPAIQGELVGGAPAVTREGERALAASGRLQGMAKTEKVAIDAAYDAARGAGRAVYTAGDVAGFARGIRDDIAPRFDLGAMPRAGRLLGQLEDASKGNVTAVTVKGLENWRKRAVAAIKSAERNDPSEAAALLAMKRRYDGFVNSAFEQGLIRGDADAVKLWRSARAKRADYGKKFEMPELKKILADNDLTPEQSLNYLFGASRLGAAQNATRALRQTKKLLGAQSPQWQGLKEEAFIRLLRNQDQGEVALFSGKKFARNLDEAMQKSPTTMNLFFDKKELARLQQFKGVGRRATVPNPDSQNPSGTSTSQRRF